MPPGPAIRGALRAVALGLSLVAVPACERDSSAAVDGFEFCAIPDSDETRFREKFAPIADYLSRELGVPVRYRHATSYPDAVDLFKNGDVLLAWFGGLTGVKARRAVPGARAIAQGAIDPRFRSYFIANASTGLERGDEFPVGIAGRRFTFGANDSTSGRLMPEHFIRERTGKSPKELFGHENEYAGSHDATCRLVQSGAFEVGACSFREYDRMVEAGEIDSGTCRVIWVTPDYADYNMTAHPELDRRFGDGFTDRLQAALLRMRDPSLLRAFPRERLITAKNEDFGAIEALALELELTR